MRKWILGGILLITTIAWAGDVIIRRPPPDTSIACILWGDCRETPLRLIPPDPRYYIVPRSVGAWSQYNDMSEGPMPWWHLTTGRPFWETLQRARDIHGLTAVGFGLRHHPTENSHLENIRKAFRTDGIDIIVLWLERWESLEENCYGGESICWQDYPLSIYETLYETYGSQDKAVFLMTFETGGRLTGMGCRDRDQCIPYPWFTDGQCEAECESGELGGIPDDLPCNIICCDLLKESRGRYMLRLFNERQAAAEAARANHPNAALKVFHTIEIDTVGRRGEHLIPARDIIPYMTRPDGTPTKPDFAPVSVWPEKFGETPEEVTESFNLVRTWTGLPAYRIPIAEVGAQERQPGDQYNRIMMVVTTLFDLGSPFALVWSLEQNAVNQQTLHALVDPETGEYRSGMQAIEELNDEY